MSIDNLAARFFKNDTKHSAEPVTYIFKLLIKLAAAWTDSKTAKIKGLLQKVWRIVLKNYRTASRLSLASNPVKHMINPKSLVMQ